MTHDLVLGFIALTDAAPLIVARERGFFEAEGLKVTLRREVSWATIRDKVGAGLFQGAHMLAPSMLASNLGIGAEPTALIAPMALGAHGASIGVSQALSAHMAQLDPARPKAAATLAQAAAARRAQGERALSFAVVFPFSMHNYMLRDWVASAGLDPDRDIHIITAPPTTIAARLRAGEIDGFSVGAPWGAVCVAESGAHVVLDAGEYWLGGPDKVLALSRAWCVHAPESARAVTRALLRAGMWADDADNRADLIAMLARESFVGASEAAIADKLAGGAPTNISFVRDGIAYPSRAHAFRILSQMVRWGQIDAPSDANDVLAAYRPDLYASASEGLGLASLPAADAFDPRALRLEAASYDITRVSG